MEPSVRDCLRQLIVDHGRRLCDDLPRCEGLLRESCGQHGREVTALVLVLKQRVPAELIAGSAAGQPVAALIDRLSKGLEDKEPLTTEAARLAVETWAFALGVSDGLVPPPSPPPAFLPADRDRLKDGGKGPEMVRLPPGRFLMGSPEGDDMAFGDEQPQHEVRIARPFAIGRFPVTFEDYDRFVVATQHPPAVKRGWMGRLIGGQHDRQRELPDDQGWGRGRRPVINVTWRDAAAYCSWLSGQTGRTYRLPSEAEWEYACRAGTETRWSFGDDEKALSGHAWFSENSGYITHPVGEKQPNPWGLHDLHGNVWEWVQDRWHEGYQGAPSDGSAWDTGGAPRVIRGCPFDFSARHCRCAYRNRPGPGVRDDGLGFRCARVQES